MVVSSACGGRRMSVNDAADPLLGREDDRWGCLQRMRARKETLPARETQNKLASGPEGGAGAGATRGAFGPATQRGWCAENASAGLQTVAGWGCRFRGAPWVGETGMPRVGIASGPTSSHYLPERCQWLD